MALRNTNDDKFIRMLKKIYMHQWYSYLEWVIGYCKIKVDPHLYYISQLYHKKLINEFDKLGNKQVIYEWWTKNPFGNKKICWGDI